MMGEMDRLYERMDRGFEQLNDRLDELNGRTRTSEQKIAVLEDRGVRSSDPSARVGAGVSGLIAAVSALWSYLKG